jgi:NlpC/P60 family putative phage cell wall peptidase
MTHPIVATARSWIGTRFHHQGRLKKTGSHKGGVDCLGLLVGIADELDLRRTDGTRLASTDETDYAHQPDSKRLKSKLAELLMPIPVGGISAGDILLLRIDDNPQHLAVVSDMADDLGIIHAYASARAVVEHQLDSWWKARIEAAFRFIAK